MNNLTEALTSLIREEIASPIAKLDEIKGKEVKSIEWVKVFQIKGLPEDRKLFSGQIIEIRPEGEFRFMEKQPYDARGITMKFWTIGMKIKYDNKLQDFIIEDIGDFGVFLN